MVDQYRTRSWGARLVAPVVFFAAVTLLVLIVQSSLDDFGGNEQTTPTITTVANGKEVASVEEDTSSELGAEKLTEAEGTGSSAKDFYGVQSGDTLESIAARFDTTVADLLELNPDIDPLALATGSHIRVS